MPTRARWVWPPRTVEIVAALLVTYPVGLVWLWNHARWGRWIPWAWTIGALPLFVLHVFLVVRLPDLVFVLTAPYGLAEYRSARATGVAGFELAARTAFCMLAGPWIGAALALRTEKRHEDRQAPPGSVASQREPRRAPLRRLLATLAAQWPVLVLIVAAELLVVFVSGKGHGMLLDYLPALLVLVATVLLVRSSAAQSQAARERIAEQPDQTILIRQQERQRTVTIVTSGVIALGLLASVATIPFAGPDASVPTLIGAGGFAAAFGALVILLSSLDG